MAYTETDKFKTLISIRNAKLKNVYFAVHALEKACTDIEEIQGDADYFVRDGLLPTELPALKCELERMLNLIETPGYKKWLRELTTTKTTQP